MQEFRWYSYNSMHKMNLIEIEMEIEIDRYSSARIYLFG